MDKNIPSEPNERNDKRESMQRTVRKAVEDYRAFFASASEEEKETYALMAKKMVVQALKRSQEG